jgi:hypothetical protein
MKKLAIMLCSVLTVQLLWSPAIAGTMPSTAPEPVDADGIVSGKAALKVVGPLHVSEGLVIMKDNGITVLSDATDPVKEAELSGQLLHVHAVGDGPDRTIKGVALFTRGYSITALDTAPANECVRVTDGVTYVGHISNTSPDWLHIDTNDGVKVVPTRTITEIKSPRAFEFSIAANSTPTTVVASQVAAAPNQITFNPTYTEEVNSTTLALHASTVHRQLAERHVKRRLLTTATVVSAFTACVALPMGMALFTQRPNRF